MATLPPGQDACAGAGASTARALQLNTPPRTAATARGRRVDLVGALPGRLCAAPAGRLFDRVLNICVTSGGRPDSE
jgi:hypothetical protein